MTRYSSYLRDIPTDFEQPRNTIVAKIMKVQVDDIEQLTCARKIRADRVATVWKDLRSLPRHREDYLQSFRWNFAPYVVSDLLSGIFHIPHQNTAPFRVKVLP